LNRYVEPESSVPAIEVVRTPRARKQLQVDRLQQFKRRHREQAQRALDRLGEVIEGGGNVFAQLLHAVEHCSLGQITGRLHELVGRYRPTI